MQVALPGLVLMRMVWLAVAGQMPVVAVGRVMLVVTAGCERMPLLLLVMMVVVAAV